MFLHAWRLRFAHPATGETIELLSPLPDELAQVTGPHVATTQGSGPHASAPPNA